MRPTGDDSGERPRRLIILTAGIGAGHDGAARAWGLQLARAGYSVEILDLLTVLRHRRRPRVSRAYELVLTHAPWLYKQLFRAGDSLFGVLMWRAILGLFLNRTAALINDPSGSLRRGRRAHAVRTPNADVPVEAVLCTYPMAGHLLGEMRRCGRLSVPAVVFLTDMSVHRLCVSPGVDAHFALHQVSAEQAARHGASTVAITGALVDQEFSVRQRCGEAEQRAARVAFGLPESGRLALLVSGSWGVGDIEQAANEISASGAATPVVVCGRNERLRSRLTGRIDGAVLGWVEDMPSLMRAVDILVENAGGLTSLEAMAIGLPVASYRPLAGHGRTNAEALEQAGVATYVRDTQHLADTLTSLIDGAQGQLQLRRAHDLFRADDPVAALESVVEAARTRPVPVPAIAQPGRTARPAHLPNAVRIGSWARHAVAAVLLVALALLGDTVGAGFAVAHGLQSVRPADQKHRSYLVIRPGQNMQFSPATIDWLRRTDAVVAVDRRYADRQPGTVRELARFGVPIVNAAADPPDGASMLHRPGAIRDGMEDITRLTGARPTLYLSSGHLHSLDLATVSVLRERVVQPRLRLDNTVPTSLKGGELVLIDCSGEPRCNLTGGLAAVSKVARRSGVELEAVTELAR